MTVIAWDGRSIAADKRRLNSGLRSVTTKLRVLRHSAAYMEVLAWSGDQDMGLLMANWYEQGASYDRFPEFQKDKELWARLIVADNLGGCKEYERTPIPLQVEDPYLAWGSGRDFAIMAMRLGRSPKEACLLASEFEVGCGDGVDEVIF